jgi:hypothetical protein
MINIYARVGIVPKGRVSGKDTHEVFMNELDAKKEAYKRKALEESHYMEAESAADGTTAVPIGRMRKIDPLRRTANTAPAVVDKAIARQQKRKMDQAAIVEPPAAPRNRSSKPGRLMKIPVMRRCSSSVRSDMAFFFARAGLQAMRLVSMQVSKDYTKPNRWKDMIREMGFQLRNDRFSSMNYRVADPFCLSRLARRYRSVRQTEGRCAWTEAQKCKTDHVPRLCP